MPLALFAAALRPSLERENFDPGEASSAGALREGWGPVEGSGANRFRWGAGPQSRLAFDLVAPRELELRLRGWSFPFAAGAGQRVSARVNGREVGEAPVGPTATELRWRVPAALLEPGENVLELRYARANSAPGERPWAMGWDRLRLTPIAGGGAAPRAPRIEATGGEIELPAGSALEGSFELPPGGRLAWEALEATGDARLQIGAAGMPEGAEPLPPAGGEVLLRGEDGTPELPMFSLRSVGTHGEIRLRGVHLLRRSPLAGRPTPADRPTPAASAVAAAAPRPNLVVYLIDTLRADHLGCYGYRRPTSPRIDRFAAGALLFRNGRAQSSWTKPAVASVLTGLFPIAHGAQLRSQRLHESVETLAERLQAAGYETALFTTNANITARFGFAQGWDTFRFLKHRKGRKYEHFDAAEMNSEIFAWLAERERRAPAKPFFLFVHTLDPHDPYRPREEYRRRFAPNVNLEQACCLRSNELATMDRPAAERQAEAAKALYDAEIAQNDAAFGELLDELDRRRLLASSAIVLTADHGEEFYEHGGWKHGFTLYEELLRIPLLLRLPGSEAAGRGIDAPANQVDIAPTLLALAGAPPAPELPGRDLRTLGLDTDTDADAPARFSFAWLERPGVRMTGVAGGRFKLIGESGEALLQQPRRQLFDLAADPLERHDLVDPERPAQVRVRWLEGGLAAAVSRFVGAEPGEEAEIDPELEKSLRALGYF